MARRAHTQGVPGVVWRLDDSNPPIESVSPGWGVPIYPPFSETTYKLFEGGLADSAPYQPGMNFTANGAPTYVAGKLGTFAIYFNGTDQWIESDQAWSALTYGQLWSMSLWVNPDVGNSESGGFGRGIFGFGIPSTDRGFQLYYNGTQQRFEGTIYGFNWNSGVGSYAPGAWYHVCYVYDGTAITVYINNTNVYSAPRAVNIGTSTIKIGRDPYGENRFFNGAVDDFRLYFYAALESIDVAELWNGGAGSPAPLSNTRAPVVTAVSDPDVPFSTCRSFDRALKQYAETYQPIGGSYIQLQAITCWINPDSLPSISGDRYVIFSRFNGTYGFILDLYSDGADLYLRLTTGDSTSTILSVPVTGSILAGAWHHIAAYAYIGARSLYINGQLVGRDTGPTIGYDALFRSRTTLGGCFIDGVGRLDAYFDGKIADLCVSEFDPINSAVSIVNSPVDVTLGLRPEASTIACYNFESPDPAVDETGSHPLTITEYPASWQFKIGTISLGTLYTVSVNTSIFTIASHADFNGGADPIGIELFFVLNGSALGGGTILEKYDSVSAPFILYVDSTDHIVARVQDSTGEFVETVSVATLPVWAGAPSVRQSDLMYVAMQWEPKTKTVSLNFNGVFSSASNLDIDLAAIANSANVVCGGNGYGGWSNNFGVSSLRFNRNIKKKYELQSAADGRRFNV